MRAAEYNWSQASPCPNCSYHVFPIELQCSNCGSGLARNAGTPASAVELVTRRLNTAFEYLVQSVLVVGGLYVCLKLSPILLMFPLFFVASQVD